MTFVSLLLALIAESLLPQSVLATLKANNSRFTAELEVDLKSLGAPRLEFVQWWIPVVLWFLGVYFLHEVAGQLGWLPVLIFNVAVVLYGIRFWHFSEVFTTSVLFLSQGDFFRAREKFLDWVAYYNHAKLQVRNQQDLIWMLVEHGIERALRQFFALLFWFVVLPGPSGVALYLVVNWSVQREQLRWQTHELMSEYVSLHALYQDNKLHALLSPRYVLFLLEWVPARLLALTWIVLGYSDDYATLWREARRHAPLSNKAPLTAVGFAAVGLRHGASQRAALLNSTLAEDAGWADLLALTAFRNLVFRSAVVWLALVALLSMMGVQTPA